MARKVRIVLPEAVRIELSDGDWIEVKKRLTYKEATRMRASLYRTDDSGRLVYNLENGDFAQVEAYLVDWSFVDHKDKPLPVAAFGNLSEDDAAEVKAAIAKHVEAMEAEKVAEKNDQAASSASEAISTSAA
jgi:hypothetical protein